MNGLPPKSGPQAPAMSDPDRDRDRDRDLEGQQQHMRDQEVHARREQDLQREAASLRNRDELQRLSHPRTMAFNSSLPNYNTNTLREQEREQEQRNRAAIQEQQRDQTQLPQHQSSSGPIPLHQPVASRLAGTIHSPGGLLAAHGAGAGLSLQGPSGSGNAFAASLLNEANRLPQHHATPMLHQSAAAQHQPFGQSANSQALLNHATQQSAQMSNPSIFSAPHGNVINSVEAAARSIQAMPFSNNMIPGMPNAAQQQQLTQSGQQPILNDALSYLDQVKVQFSEHPDVYNRFLDIMKDFKSQAIDTPGVINRVSELFAGHPNLIQGFNTFLPPGYRIECGAGNDPNSIRVTTPMGTTVQSIAGRANLHEGVPGAGYPYPPRPGQANGWGGPARSVESPDGLSPQNRAGYSGHDLAAHESQQAAAAHRQQQQGVHHLQNAVATATGQAPPRHILTPTPGQAYPQHGTEKRGPVEFNHAISYVNKIKNRFQDKPEIYKQFLEILQTYQRESKPIQDVYAQVTTLFADAIDLLDDFKQFLPESAAQAKQAAVRAAEENREAAIAMISGQAGIPSSMNNGFSGTPRMGETARLEPKLPAIGTFAPPGTKTEGLTGQTKKRARNGSSAVAANGTIGDSGTRGIAGIANKRTKTSHQDPTSSVDIEPTLIPRLAEPMPPASTVSSNQREVAFFDKAKKSISNKQSFAEFLKLCNMFSMDLIDKSVLVHRVSSFLGGNTELMDFFKNMVKYVPGDEIIENVPSEALNSGRVSLSNCRGLGPSYRLLPRREKLKACSGRDEMCNSVLNDEWASHPTWASEDSGFVAHRKNVFEESLHRIEEERHDYDFSIEANAKVIQLLEPIGLQLCGMTKEQLQGFRMPQGLGGSSQSLYRRILKKVYGPVDGAKVCEELFLNPVSTLPIVLARLKQKDEEWRFTQREWEKIWHAQTQAMYLKSLDHLGIHIKATDKKMFSAKFIIENMKSIQEGQRRQQGTILDGQLVFDFSDQTVVLDAVRISVLYATASSHHTALETEKIANFLKEIMPLMLGITDAAVQDRIKDITIESADEDAEESVPAELTNGRGRRVNGKKDLRRGVLDKSKTGNNRALGEDNGASTSKESTPDIGSGIDDGDEMSDVQEDISTPVSTSRRWLKRDPTPVASEGEPLTEDEVNVSSADHAKREHYNMWCNQTLFVFVTLFQTLYKRLKDIKDSESDVADEIRRNKTWKPANELGVAITKPDLFRHDGTTYYSQTLSTLESYIEGTLEENAYTDFVRHYYLKKGWALYTVADLLKAICRTASTSAGNDAKDKTPEIVTRFKQDRVQETSSYSVDMTYRLNVQKLIKDSDLFLVRYYPQNRQARCSIQNEADSDRLPADRMNRWRYYTSNYAKFEHTPGVRIFSPRKVLLLRNVNGWVDSFLTTAHSLERLELKICVNSYKMTYKDFTEDMLVTPGFLLFRTAGKKDSARSEASVEKLERNNAWMRDKAPSFVQSANEDFRHWIEDGALPKQKSLFLTNED